MRTTNQLTLDDIARQAGVARSTVHRVLNNSGSASKETRQRVLEAIAHLKKEKATHGQSFNDRPHHLAVICPSVWSPEREGLYRIYYRGVHQAAAEQGFVVHLISAQAHESPLHLVDEFHQEGILNLDSVVVMGLSEEDPTLHNFHRRGIAVCIMGRYLSSSPFGWVGVDYEEGAYLAIHYLAGLGHRRIVLASQGHPSPSYHGWHTAGYQRAMREADLIVDPTLIINNAEQAVEQIVEQVQRGATGIYATTDELAITLCRILTDHGWTIPDDVSIVSFNDLTAKDHNPPLTAIFWSHQLVGPLAVQIVASRIKNPYIQAQHTILRPELHIRSTTAPAPAPNRR